MRMLIADDDPVSRVQLAAILTEDGHEVTAVEDGAAAWDVLRQPGAPWLSVLGWVMPGLEGPEVCRLVRGLGVAHSAYLLLAAAREQADDVVAGLGCGADDFLAKPYERADVRARLRVGSRMLALQQKLTQRVRELEAALANVKQLQVLLPMCCYCKKI